MAHASGRTGPAANEFTRPLIAGLLARRPARPVRLSVTHELVAGAREPPFGAVTRWLMIFNRAAQI